MTQKEINYIVSRVIEYDCGKILPVDLGTLVQCIIFGHLLQSKMNRFNDTNLSRKTLEWTPRAMCSPHTLSYRHTNVADRRTTAVSQVSCSYKISSCDSKTEFNLRKRRVVRSGGWFSHHFGLGSVMTHVNTVNGNTGEEWKNIAYRLLQIILGRF